MTAAGSITFVKGTLVDASQKAEKETERDFFRAAAAEADVTNLKNELKASPDYAHSANTDSTVEPHAHAALKGKQSTLTPHAVMSHLFWHYRFGITQRIIQDYTIVWLSIPSWERVV